MVCGAVAEAVQRSEAHVAEALRLEETLRERIAALPPADFEDILHSAFILSLHVRPGASVLHVRATPTSLLRAVLVRTRGTGQLAPERHALYVHRTRITLGRAPRAPHRPPPPITITLQYRVLWRPRSSRRTSGSSSRSVAPWGSPSASRRRTR